MRGVMNGVVGLPIGDLWVAFLAMIALVYILGWLALLWITKVYKKRG
jgi:hypothetical protein